MCYCVHCTVSVTVLNTVLAVRRAIQPLSQCLASVRTTLQGTMIYTRPAPSTPHSTREAQEATPRHYIMSVSRRVTNSVASETLISEQRG